MNEQHFQALVIYFNLLIEAQNADHRVDREIDEVIQALRSELGLNKATIVPLPVYG